MGIEFIWVIKVTPGRGVGKEDREETPPTVTRVTQRSLGPV